MKKRLKRISKRLLIASGVLLLLFSFSAQIAAQTQGSAGSGISRAESKGKVNLDFTDADIRDVVKSVSEITGRNFILDERVRGKITIISPSPVSVKEAYQAFISALEVKNFTVVKVGKIHKIVPIRDAKQMPIRTVSEDYRTPYGDAFITRLIPIKYISANEIAQSLKSLHSPDGSITAYGPTNTLIVTDSASNIRRLMTIIRRLDKKTFQEQIEVVPLKYANAVDMAEKLRQIFPTQKRPTKTSFRRRRSSSKSSDVDSKQIISNIIPDERTNSLIVMANARGITKVREFLKRLDSFTEQPSGKIHVHYLEHANAEELSATLSGVASQAASKGRPATARKNPAARAPGQLFGGDVKISADISTNSLVIISSQQDYEALKPIIYKLDLPRRQVFIEALILEVSANPSMNVGWSGNMGGTAGGASLFGGSQFSGLNAISPTSLLGASGAVFGFRGREINLNINGESVSVPIYGAVFNALQKNSLLNVVSTPTILTMDNKEAEIVVGDEIPIPTTASQSTSAANAPVLQSISRQDVATILRVTPQVNESNYVTLDIYQEVSEIVSETDLGARTSKRKAKTTVVAQSGQTIVIGGLIKDKESNAVSKVPLLGDIPLLGWFFRSKSKAKQKVNLMIYITPYVIHSPLDIERVTRAKHRQLRRSIRRGGLKEPDAMKYNPMLKDEKGFRAPTQRNKKHYEEVMPGKPQSMSSRGSKSRVRRGPVRGKDKDGEFVILGDVQEVKSGHEIRPREELYQQIEKQSGTKLEEVDKGKKLNSPFDDIKPPSSE